MKCLLAVWALFAGFITRQEEGFSVVEYGLLLALIAIVALGCIIALGTRINSLCGALANSL